MNKDVQHVVIDAGNTLVKIALFENGQLTEIQRIETSKFLTRAISNHTFSQLTGIISSVLDESSTSYINSLFPEAKVLDRNYKLPISLNYDTPNTLGIDRLCNAVYCWSANKNGGSVCIDIGSCIKFDFVDKNGVYQGGSISPGILLRYKSMNDYTANLPLLDDTSFPSLVGKSTYGSMHAGVIQGIHTEIFGMMQRYLDMDSDLTFFMTGGDAKHFDFPLKNNIFAVENLTLVGLYQIFVFND